MFGSLFLKECKMWTKSIVFYAYVIILFLFYITQMGEENVLEKPQPNQESYGTTYSEDENEIMNGTLKDLIADYDIGSFATYPVGFYKQVTLSEEEMAVIEDAVSDLTGMTKEQWQAEYDAYIEGYTADFDENGVYVEEETVPWSITISENLTYDKFKEIMKKVSETIGPGSNYSENNLKKHSIVSKTYEQALKEYEAILEKDKVTGAYARLFCDYIGIILGILPAFFAVTRGIRDKRSQVSSVIYSKKAGSVSVVFSRYLGMVVMMLLPVLVISCFSMAQSLYIADAAGVSPDYLAYVKYVMGWLLPIILFVAALACFVTELTESMLGILVSAVVWFTSVFMGMSDFLRHAGWNLIPRFNTVGEYEVFQDMRNQLIYNRIFYVIISIVIIAVSVFVYNKKRKGVYQIHGKVFKNRRSKCEA